VTEHVIAGGLAAETGRAARDEIENKKTTNIETIVRFRLTFNK
jgi:hypothetical protein